MITEEYLRPALVKFSRHMEDRLRAHDDRPGWSNEPFDYLYGRMLFKSDELPWGKDKSLAIKNAVDIANYAMMIADNLSAEQELEDQKSQKEEK